jgi:drug/metabolite transporter (DMT)-like permease
VRRATRTDHALVIIFYFPLVAVPATVPFAIRTWVWPDLRGWLLLLGLGVATQLGQLFLTHGLARVPAGRATTVGYVQIVFAALLGFVAFGDVPGLSTALGAVLIVAAMVVLLRRRVRSSS